VPVIILYFLARTYGAISQHFAVPLALVLTLSLLIALLLFETLLRVISRRHSAPTTLPEQPRARDVVVRCVRVAAYIGVAVTIAQAWVVGVFALVDSERWRSLTHASFTAGGAMFLAYVCWEIMHFFCDRYIAQNSPSMSPVSAQGTIPPSATRLATILPLVRLASSILILVIAGLVVLSELESTSPH
jgi:hypothetical protein